MAIFKEGDRAKEEDHTKPSEQTKPRGADGMEPKELTEQTEPWGGL